MKVSNIQDIYHKNGISAIRPQGAAYNSKTEFSSTQRADKVTLSSAGIKASAQPGQPDLEDFRLPSWYGQYFPEQLTLNSAVMEQAVNESRAFAQLHDKFYSDGKISGNEQRILNNFLNKKMPANQAFRDQQESASRLRSELSEYVAKLDKYFKEAMDEQGITQENFREKVLQAEGDNPGLHQKVKKRLLADPAALALMDTLGIKRPVV